MSNPVLQSESFERAAYALVNEMIRHGQVMENFGTSDFENSVQTFARSVDRLATILGMQAENDQRKVIGASMAYDFDAFVKV